MSRCLRCQSWICLLICRPSSASDAVRSGGISNDVMRASSTSFSRRASRCSSSTCCHISCMRSSRVRVHAIQPFASPWISRTLYMNVATILRGASRWSCRKRRQRSAERYLRQQRTWSESCHFTPSLSAALKRAKRCHTRFDLNAIHTRWIRAAASARRRASRRGAQRAGARRRRRRGREPRVRGRDEPAAAELGALAPARRARGPQRLLAQFREQRSPPPALRARAARATLRRREAMRCGAASRSGGMSDGTRWPLMSRIATSSSRRAARGRALARVARRAAERPDDASEPSSSSASEPSSLEPGAKLSAKLTRRPPGERSASSVRRRPAVRRRRRPAAASRARVCRSRRRARATARSRRPRARRGRGAAP